MLKGPRSDVLSLPEARRIALAAQGLVAKRRDRTVTARTIGKLIDDLGVVQIDSVNVLARAHYLPLFARLGDYRTDLLDQLAYSRKRTVFEYWGHEASYLPMAFHPLFRWRMERAAAGQGIYGGLVSFSRERADFVAEVLAEVRDRGPLAASDLTNGGRGTGPWWGWSDGKTALEWLFWIGVVTTAERRGFERVYDLTERVVPPDILATVVSEEVAHRALLRQSAKALGVATEVDLRDYYRLKPADARPRLAELVEEGTLVPVTVEGWQQAAYRFHDVQVPSRATGRTLLAPFDPLIWERSRAERLFGFRYRLEIYTPAHKREYGYYVLPFLMGDRLVARLDLKADRQGRRLLVIAAHGEPGMRSEKVVPALWEELQLMARWLNLEAVFVHPSGDLAAALEAVAAAHPADAIA